MIEELRRFIQVAQNSNITQTAEQIFITQSALSQSIDRLEKELKTTLFIQKGKTIQLTSDGLAVLQIGTKILELWQKAKDPMVRQSTQPTFTIGAFDNAALRLGKYFQKCMQQNLFRLEIVIAPSHKLLSQLQLGVIDVAICIVDKKPLYNKNLELIKNYSEELIPVSAKIYKDKLEDIPFILYNQESFTRQYIDACFLTKSVSPQIFAESTSVTFMKELAMLGCGVALLPKNTVQIELQQKLLKKQKFPLIWQREYGIFIHK